MGDNPLSIEGGMGGILPPIGGGASTPAEKASGIGPQGGDTISATDDLDKGIVPYEALAFQIPQLIPPKMSLEELQKEYPQLVEFLKSVNIDAAEFLNADSVTQYMMLFMSNIVNDMWDKYRDTLENIEKEKAEDWKVSAEELAGLKYSAFRHELTRVGMMLYQFQLDRAAFRTNEQVEIFNDTNRQITVNSIASAALAAQVKFSFANPIFVDDLQKYAEARVDSQSQVPREQMNEEQLAERDKQIAIWVHSAKIQILFNTIGAMLQIPGIGDTKKAIENVLQGGSRQHQDIELLRDILSVELSELTALIGRSAAMKMFYDLGASMAAAPNPEGYLHSVASFLAVIQGEDMPSTREHHKV